MLKNILLLFCFLGLVSCSSSKSSDDVPEDLTGEVSELESEIFKTEESISDLDEGLSEEDLDVSSSDDEFEDPDLSIAAGGEEGVSQEELDLDDEELDLDEDLEIAGSTETESFDDFGSDDGELDLDDDLEVADVGEDAFDDLDEGELDLSEDTDDLSDLDSFDDFNSKENLSDELNSDDNLQSSEDDFDIDIPVGSIDDDFEDVSIDDEDLIVEDDLSPRKKNKNGEEIIPANKVLSVDYDSAVNGGVFLVKTRELTDYNTEFIPETNQFIVELKNATIDKSLQRPFLTKDFKQNFGALNSYQDSDGDAKIIVQLKTDLTPYITRNGNTISIAAGTPEQIAQLAEIGGSITPLETDYDREQKKKALNSTSLEDYLLENTSYYGKPISIQVKDAEIVDVINLISEEVGANLVLSEGVTGKVSIKLKQIPWDQALITIMKTRGLGYVRSGSVLRIAPLAELQAESQAATAVQNARKSLTPYHVKVFPLSYASPETLEEKLKPFLSAAGGAGAPAGQIISENRSSSIIINDTKEVINNVEKLIKELDRPPLQVMIEAKVVEATKEFTREFSSRFNSTGNSNTSGSDLIVNNTSSWNANTTNTAPFENNIALTGLNFFGNLTHILRLNEIERKIKVLSAPKVLAMNNEQATIVQVSQVLNQTQTIEEGEPLVTAEPIDVELRLEVTPQITSDSNVIMNLLVRRQFPGTVDANLGATPINTREARTKVIVGNNRTTVIGGIYQVDNTREERGVPVIRKMPLLKWLFGNKINRKIDSELMVFVTPRILNRKGRLSPVGKTPVASSSKSSAL